MTSLRPTWLDRPRQMRARRLIFQVHLWIGITLGVYIVLISVSGSIAVFRREASLWLIPRTVETVGERMLGDDELGAAVLQQYPRHRLVRVGTRSGADRPVSVTLDRNGSEIRRLVDPYTGEVLGDPFPPVVRAMEWIVRLHDDLLAGDVGRKVNGVAGGFVVALVLTGAVVWWPGRRRWTDGVRIRFGPSAPRVSSQLHSMLGFWCFALLFIWALTGVYFAYPQTVEGLIDRFDPNLDDLERPGESLLLGLIRLHFGRFGGLGIRVTWALLGLVPAVLFVTAFMMWWRRVVRRRIAALRSSPGAVMQTQAAAPQSPRSSFD